MTNSRLLIAVTLLAGAASADTGSETLASRVDSAVAPYVERGDFMGVIAAQRPGEEPLVRAYGVASVELGVPHRADDVFMIGSISKQFTAAAILLLAEEGLLETSDRVRRHLPKFPHGDRITIHQLLTHTSGVEDVYSLASFGMSGGRFGSFDNVVAELGAAPLTHEPGSAYRYSNGGYSILAAIIETVSGLSYGEFLTTRIFGPLGMADTRHAAPGPAVERSVSGYEPWGASDLTASVPVAAAYLAGSGSLWSSARDLLLWSEALHGGRLLSEESYESMISDHGHGYGYGVSRFERFGRDVVGHDGRVSGYASDLARYLDEKLTVVVLSNVESVARDEIRRLVAGAVLGGDVEARPLPQIVDRPAHDPSSLAGAYRFGPGFVVNVTSENGRLLAQANEGGFSELVPTSDGRWFSRMLYATVRFGTDEEGVVDRLVWGEGERAPVGVRE